MARPFHIDLPTVLCAGDLFTLLHEESPGLWRQGTLGEGWRVAQALAALDHLAAQAAALGTDVFGQALWRQLADAHLDLRFVQQVSHPSVLVCQPATDEGWLHAVLDGADWRLAPQAWPQGGTRALRWLVVGGLGLAHEPLASRLLALAAELATQGVKVAYLPHWHESMDAGYDGHFHAWCEAADVVAVSRAELCALCRTPDAASALSRVSAWNPRAHVLQREPDGSLSAYAGLQSWHWAQGGLPTQAHSLALMLAGWLHAQLSGIGDPAMASRWAWSLAQLGVPDAPDWRRRALEALKAAQEAG